MNITYQNGNVTKLTELTAEEVQQRTKAALDDPDVTRIEIFPNRHERRKQAAEDRKRRKPQQS